MLEGDYPELKRQIYANLSITHLKLKHFQSCIMYSKKVLLIDPDNPKIHRRLVAAYQEIKDFENAYRHMKKVEQGKKLEDMRSMLTRERKNFLKNCFDSEDKKKFKASARMTPEGSTEMKEAEEEVQIVFSEPRREGNMIIVNGEEFWFG